MTLPDRRKRRKSSYSADQNDCVELVYPGENIATVGVADTKDREGGQLEFSIGAARAFLAHLRRDIVS